MLQYSQHGDVQATFSRMSETHFYQGEHYGLTNDFDRAIEEFNQAARLDPQNPRIYRSGRVYAILEDVSRARTDLQQGLALGLDPDRAQQAQTLLDSLK